MHVVTAVLGVLESRTRWMSWLREVDHITSFVKTGEICSRCQMTDTEKKYLVQMAQKYYIESALL